MAFSITMAHAAQVAFNTSGRGAPFRILEIDRDHAKATAFNMLFMVWRYHTLPDAYRKAIRIAEELGQRHPEGVGVCQLVEVEAVAPGAETRRLFLELWKQAPVKHYSVTHEGTGFKAASVRAVVASVHALGCRNCEHSVHKSLREAAEWHAAQQRVIGRKESAEFIVACMQALRTQLRASFP